MRKVYAIRAVGTDKWVVSFRQDRANLGSFENARFYNKIGPARGLATKSTKSNGIALEVVEFSLEEVKPAKAPSWDEFKKYVDNEIAKVKPLTTPWVSPPYSGDEDSPWQPKRRPPWKHEIWCQAELEDKKAQLMNTEVNTSLMTPSNTGD